jgi:DNA-binding transcriptional LysR family regulator
MDLRQLSYFVGVAEHGRFTLAANRLLVAQPAVSAQIKRLERELGETLFHRDRRGVALTAAGEALLPHARAALAAADRGRDAIASLRGILHGRLSIGVAGPVDERLAETLGAFHRAYPAIEISLTNHHNEPLLRALGAEEVDVAVLGVGAQRLPPQVRASVVAVEPLVVAVRRSDPLEKRKTITLAELSERPMVTLIHGSGLRALLEGACRDAGFSPAIAAETGELDSLVGLAAEGIGVAIVPRSAVEGAPVAVLRLTRPRLERRTALAWNRVSISPAGRAFLELARDRFSAAA